MRDHYNYLTHNLNCNELAGIDITLWVSRLPVNIRDLARAGWSCKIVHNRYGGRSRISFHSLDGRSVIAFRTPGSYRNLSHFDLFNLLSEETNSGILTPGVLTTNAQPIPAPQSDLELLERVGRGIKRRLAEHRKAHPRKIDRTVVERAIAAVA